MRRAHGVCERGNGSNGSRGGRGATSVGWRDDGDDRGEGMRGREYEDEDEGGGKGKIRREVVDRKGRLRGADGQGKMVFKY